MGCSPWAVQRRLKRREKQFEVLLDGCYLALEFVSKKERRWDCCGGRTSLVVSWGSLVTWCHHLGVELGWTSEASRSSSAEQDSWAVMALSVVEWECCSLNCFFSFFSGHLYVHSWHASGDLRDIVCVWVVFIKFLFRACLVSCKTFAKCKKFCNFTFKVVWFRLQNAKCKTLLQLFFSHLQLLQLNLWSCKSHFYTHIFPLAVATVNFVVM